MRETHHKLRECIRTVQNCDPTAEDTIFFTGNDASIAVVLQVPLVEFHVLVIRKQDLEGFIRHLRLVVRGRLTEVDPGVQFDILATIQGIRPFHRQTERYDFPELKVDEIAETAIVDDVLPMQPQCRFQTVTI